MALRQAVNGQGVDHLAALLIIMPMGRQGSSHVRAQPPTSQDAPTSNLMAAAAAHGQHSEDTSSGAASDSDADGA
ncbi:hypothetical protein HaLaN_30799, partial [Haematococcus lacustris]